MTYSTSDTVLNIPALVNNSNFTFVFLKLLAMLILVQKENEQSQVYEFQDIYLESLQFHWLAKMHQFEFINHNTHLRFSFEILFKHFLRACNLYQ